MSVFLDTVGLIALWNHDDQWHESAHKAFDRIIAERLPLITTGFVLLECANAASRTAVRANVVQLRDDLIAANCLVDPTPAEFESAWNLFRPAIQILRVLLTSFHSL